MKFLIIFTLLLTSQLSFGKDFLSKSQKDITLKEVDIICADTWCSGDYNFKFVSIQCDDSKAICQLNYEMFVWDHDEAKLSLNCKIRPVKKFSDMVVSSKGYHAINQNFYQQLTTCFQSNIHKYGTQLLY